MALLDTFKNARGKTIAGTVGLATIAALTFTPAAFADHGGAHPSSYTHQQGTVATQQCAPSKAEFLFNRVDVRGQSEAGVVSAAVASSQNGVSVVLYTTDKEVWRIAYLAAEERGNSGCPTTLVLAADGQNKIEIWAAGQFVGENPNPVANEQLKRALSAGMDYAYSLGFENPPVSLSLAPRKD